MSDIPTAIINDGDVPVGNAVSSVPDKYLSSPKKKKKKKRKEEAIETELLTPVYST